MIPLLLFLLALSLRLGRLLQPHSSVEEMRFLDLVVGKHSKKPACWSHRKWCLDRRLGDLQRQSQGAETEKVTLLQHELDIAAKVTTNRTRTHLVVAGVLGSTIILMVWAPFAPLSSSPTLRPPQASPRTTTPGRIACGYSPICPHPSSNPSCPSPCRGPTSTSPMPQDSTTPTSYWRGCGASRRWLGWSRWLSYGTSQPACWIDGLVTRACGEGWW